MKHIQNIDEMLRDSMGDFSPDAPPDAWSGIREGLKQLPANPAAHPAAGVKGVSLITKIILTVAIPAAVAGGYFAYNAFSTTEDQAKAETIVVLAAPPPVTEPVSEPVKALEAIKTEKPEEKPTINTVKSSITSAGKLEKRAKQSSDPEVNEVNEVPVQSAPSTPPVQPQATPVSDPAQETKTAEKKQEINTRKPVEKTTIKKRVYPNIYSAEPVPDKRTEDAAEEKPQVPNVFTPNGDGSNDRFVIPVQNEVLYYLKVVDRNGAVVFESSDKNVTWDGTNMKSGEQCEAGTYSYGFRYQLRNAAEPRNLQGRIQIIR